MGAVLLPAAFHFALTYNTEDSAQEAGTSLKEQKDDILRMSHGVSQTCASLKDFADMIPL